MENRNPAIKCTQAFSKGEDAFLNKSPEPNPYPVGSFEHEYWQNGWDWQQFIKDFLEL